MNVEHERLALKYLEEALTWHRDERDWRLRVMLDKDPAMLDDVRALLTAAEAANSALPTKLPGEIIAEDPPPPARIGPYRLGTLLGKGGMGRVYRADRVDGVFEQTIAIKLMRRTRVPTQVAEQFARERQILARLQHRNIAQLFDGGITPDGHSYFVMELVVGRSITQYAREEALTLRRTLLLFEQVCSAVQYAHSHLVVHADIKPSNIIVTEDGTAKLLDFGVARVIDTSGKEILGGSDTLALTYEYASPARQKGEVPSTVDDVYSLGILLADLLKRVGPIAPDLRSICQRARAAEVESRYASVSELQADIERWLDGLPVLAHGSGWSYIAGRFVSRYRFAVGMGSAVLVVLFGAAVALAVLYMHAERAKLQAEEAQLQAETRFSDLRSLSRYVLFDVYDQLEATPRALTLRRDIADAGQRYLDRLAQDPRAPTEVRMEVAEGLRRLAQVQAAPGMASLAQVPLARANLDRAETMARSLPEDGIERKPRALLLARIGLARAALASEQDLDFKASRDHLTQVSALLDQVLEEDPGDDHAAELRLDVAYADVNILEWQGHYAEAIEKARAALVHAGSLRPATKGARHSLDLKRARLFDILAEGLYYSGKPALAEPEYRKEYELLQEMSAASPHDVGLSRRLARAGWAWGSTLVENKRALQAEPILADAKALGASLLVLEPDDRELTRMVEIITTAHAQALVALGRYSQARPALEDAVNAREQRWKESPLDWSRARDYAIAQSALADMWADAGEPAAACDAYNGSLETFARIRAADKVTQLDTDYSLPNIYKRIDTLCPALARAFPVSR